MSVNGPRSGHFQEQQRSIELLRFEIRTNDSITGFPRVIKSLYFGFCRFKALKRS